MTIKKKKIEYDTQVFEEVTVQPDTVETFTIESVDNIIEKLEAEKLRIEQRIATLEQKKSDALGLE